MFPSNDVIKFTFLFILSFGFGQNNLINNTHGRQTVSLNGTWKYIIDPYDTGFYNYRYNERPENDMGAYWNIPQHLKKSDLSEHDYTPTDWLKVPGDWNSQGDKFLYYEGTIWYQRNFDSPKLNPHEELHLYFGAVNYEAHVYLNGKKLGSHKGGFTPFNFKIPQDFLKAKDNNLVVRVNNQRSVDEVPTVNTDWWNYGGITRDVKLIVTTKQFIQNYKLQLDQTQDISKAIKSNKFRLKGEFQFNEFIKNGFAEIKIPELGVQENIEVTNSNVEFDIEVSDLTLWSPKQPKRYEVSINFNNHSIKDQIGFRTIAVKGSKILLNGESIFLKGICLHEEIPSQQRRANSRQDALNLFRGVQDLNANFARLAHYPHNEYMTKVADSLGIMLWTEIPVYWTIDFDNPKVLENAKNQLTEMITRDRNRASVIIWGVGNETPVGPSRNHFMSALVKKAKQLDQSRLVTAALEVGYNKGVNYVDDPLGEFTDLITLNEYLGWYGSTPEACQTAQWKIKYDKPFFISETGAGAKAGFHGDKNSRFSEEYQQWFYEEQIKMFESQFPESFSGLTPWILYDFKSPKRNNPKYQQGWNRKGLISNEGRKKKAFYSLKNYYESK